MVVLVEAFLDILPNPDLVQLYGLEVDLCLIVRGNSQQVLLGSGCLSRLKIRFFALEVYGGPDGTGRGMSSGSS